MMLVSDMNASLTESHTIQISTYEYIDTPSRTKVIKRERKLCFVYFKPPDTDSITANNGITDRIAIDIAVYSDSIVLVATVDCNLDTQITGQFAMLIIYPVLDLTLSGFVPSSVPHPQAKAASTYTSVQSDAVSIGLRINPLSSVPFK